MIRIVVLSLLAGAMLSADIPQERAVEREQRQARALLSEAFPRTRGLMAHLEKHDRETYERLLTHSRELSDKAAQRATKFVEQNHPELAKVLDDLRGNNHRSFRPAMRELVRDVTRLSRIKRDMPKSYPAALEAWRFKSRIRLRGARLALRGSGGSLDELKEYITRKQAAERRQTKARIERLRAQIGRLEAKLEEDPDAAVQRELKAIQRKIERRRKRR